MRITSFGEVVDMPRKRNIGPHDREAARRLKQAWDDWQQKHPGMTQAKAAERLGWTQSALSQYIRGEVPLRIAATFKLAEFFGVHPHQLRPDLKLPGAPTAREPEVSYAALPEEALELARAWLTLPSARREFYRQTIWIEAAARKLHPWLRFGKPETERYTDWEEKMRRDADRVP